MVFTNSQKKKLSVSVQHVFKSHLNTLATPSRLRSSPSFPNRASTPFSTSLGSTGPTAITAYTPDRAHRERERKRERGIYTLSEATQWLSLWSIFMVSELPRLFLTLKIKNDLVNIDLESSLEHKTPHTGAEISSALYMLCWATNQSHKKKKKNTQ